MQGPPAMIRAVCVIGMLARPGVSWKLVVQGGLRRPCEDKLIRRVWWCCAHSGGHFGVVLM